MNKLLYIFSLVGFLIILGFNPVASAQENESNGSENLESEKSLLEEKIMILEKGEEIIEQDGKIKKKYKIITTDENGEQVEMIWEGDENDEMPIQMKGIINKNDLKKVKKEEKEVEVKVEANDMDQKKVMIKILENGEERDYMFETVDGKIPTEAQEFLDKEGVELDLKDDLQVQQKRSGPKGQLGVMIKNVEEGIYITDIIKGSSAEVAGLKQGDIIIAVDEEKLITMRELVGKISSYNADDKIKVDFIRNEETMSRDVILKKRTPRTWDEVMGKN